MRKLLLAFASLLIPTAALAVTIESVTPSSGPTGGGTQVTIRGTDFGEIIGSPSLPPAVFFGFTPALVVDAPDASTLVVITPPHLPGVVNVSVHQSDGNATAPNAFVFVEDGDDAFERILLPVLVPPVAGAFGSEFHTSLRAAGGRLQLPRIDIYGLTPACPPILCIPFDPAAPLSIYGRNTLRPDEIELNGTPGRFLYVPDSHVESLALNLRVADVTRADQNFGTEMPIVREREFGHRFVLLGVPTDARFRSTLRIYGPYQWSVRVRVGNEEAFDVVLSQPANQFEPAYAEIRLTPDAGSPFVDVSVEQTPNNLPVVPPLLWAFISVTNNDTQTITTITPRP